MAIHFEKEQYAALRQTYRKWWAGELDRPIVPILTVGHGTPAMENKLPLGFANAWDTSIDPREFVNTYSVYVSIKEKNYLFLTLIKTIVFYPFYYPLQIYNL